MSSLVVRQAFEAAWPAKMPTLSLEDSLNDEPDRTTLPTTWATVDYSGAEDPASVGQVACFRETGQILVVVWGPAGSGNAAILALAEQARTAFRRWNGTGINLSITKADPPEEGSPSNGRWYGAAVSFEYVYDTVIGA